MSEDTQALVEDVRDGLNRLYAGAYLMAQFDSLTAALERAERERDAYLNAKVDAEERAEAAEARAQKAEAVVEAARLMDQAYRPYREDMVGLALEAIHVALTAYDAPTEQA